MVIEIDTDGIFRFFGLIQYIITNADQHIYYVYKKLETLRFSQHVHAFEVVRTDVWGCITHTKLISSFPNYIHVMADGRHYVSCM